ncbi:hypothetical protein GE21DRAFT_1288653 [Neurospora crassa]|nr:hypothetical protein GE21DRAFT_1288653 [Neurospora crassa]
MNQREPSCASYPARPQPPRPCQLSRDPSAHRTGAVGDGSDLGSALDPPAQWM